MAKYPINFDLSGKTVLVIGADCRALDHIYQLRQAGADVIVISERIDRVFASRCPGPQIELIISRYRRDYLDAADMAMVCVKDAELCETIRNDCKDMKVLCFLPDDPENSDFSLPTVVKRGSLSLSISTERGCRVCSEMIKARIEKLFTDLHGDFVRELEETTRTLSSAIPSPREKLAIFRHLASEESFEFFRQAGALAWKENAMSLFGHNLGRDKAVN